MWFIVDNVCESNLLRLSKCCAVFGNPNKVVYELNRCKVCFRFKCPTENAELKTMCMVRVEGNILIAIAILIVELVHSVFVVVICIDV